MPLTPQDFVSKWKRSTGREKQIYQQHFLDLCELVGHPTPAAFDPTGTRFAFEMGVEKNSGGDGCNTTCFETFLFPWARSRPQTPRSSSLRGVWLEE